MPRGRHSETREHKPIGSLEGEAGWEGHLIGILTECGGGAVKHVKLLREHARVLGERPP
jgi:hypothetical protein